MVPREHAPPGFGSGQLHVPGRPTARQLLERARRHGLDLRRAAFTSFLVDTGRNPEAARTIRRRCAEDGWDSSVYPDNVHTSTIYTDHARWIVRVGRSGRLKPEALAEQLRYAELVAGQCGGQVVGWTVESTERVSPWKALADRLEREDARGAAGLVPGPPGDATRELRQPAASDDVGETAG